MELSPELMRKIDSNILELDMSDFQELKRFYMHNNKAFIQLINKIISKYNKREDLDGFLHLVDYLSVEIEDIAPFLSKAINKIFILMLKNNYYKQIAQYSNIVGACASIRVLELLNNFVKGKAANKFLTSVETYKIKKLVYELLTKYKNEDVAHRIQLELEKEDLGWVEQRER